LADARRPAGARIPVPDIAWTRDDLVVPSSAVASLPLGALAPWRLAG
jgi:hypothetical protein